MTNMYNSLGLGDLQTGIKTGKKELFPRFDEKCEDLLENFQKRTGTILRSNEEGLISDDY